MSGRSLRAELALVGITIIWGASFTLVKAALADASTVLFLAARFTLAAMVLAIAFRGSIPTGPDTRRAVAGGVVAGLCLAGGYLGQTFGLRFTSASKSAFLTALFIVLVPLAGAIVYQNVPRAIEALGIGCAMLGMGLMTWPRGEMGWNTGDLLTIGCAAAFSGHILVLGHWAPRGGFTVLSLMQLTTVAALMLATFWWVEPVRWEWSTRLTAAVLVTGLLCTALAFSVQAWAQQHTSATRTALIFALEPVSAWVTAWLAAGETLGGRVAAGAVLILGGVILVELKPPLLRRHP